MEGRRTLEGICGDEAIYGFLVTDDPTALLDEMLGIMWEIFRDEFERSWKWTCDGNYNGGAGIVLES